MTAKKFDCVAMKRAGALRIYRRLHNSTFEEKVAYWMERSSAFHEEEQGRRHRRQRTNTDSRH